MGAGNNGISSTKEASVTVNLLHKRMARELYHLAKISTGVETALGDIVGQSNLLNDELITALQGLDRIRQNLEDFARLSIVIASLDENWGCKLVLNSEIKQQIVLSELVTRLTQSIETISSKADLKQDVLWL